MIALLFAAQLAAASPLVEGRPGPQPQPDKPQTERRLPLPMPGVVQSERTPNLYRLPERCKDAPVKIVDRFGRPVPQKLGNLPKGALIYAVDRRVDGCPVLVVVYGTPELDNPNPPPRNGVEPVAPARREDGPPNKR